MKTSCALRLLLCLFFFSGTAVFLFTKYNPYVITKHFNEGQNRSSTLTHQPSQDFKDRYVSYPDSKPFSFRCGTCSYVASSGHLKGSGLQREIDSRECVIRTNDAPTVGFERDVGNRTTIRTLGPRSLDIVTEKATAENPVIDRDFGDQILMVTMPNYKEAQNKKNFEKLLQRYKGIKIYRVTQKEFKHFERIFNENVDNTSMNFWRTNGFYTLVFLREICGEIHVYGISYPEYCQENPNNNVPYHYYGKTGPECRVFERSSAAKSHAHRFVKEKICYRRWMTEWGNLHFHCPEWK